MSNLLKDLLAIRNALTEDEVKPVETATPANPVSAEPVTAPATEAPAPEADVVAEPEDLVEEEYESSAEFTEDFFSLSEKLAEIKAIVTSSKFQHWMKVTDQNFNTDVTSHANSVAGDIDTLEASLKALEDELGKAE